jgi:uncharacterized membrane protein YkvI
MATVLPSAPSWFRRYLLPGLVFKGVVIGGGYATGRELVEFFLGSGPRGGVAGMLLAMLIWSLVCAIAFLYARSVAAYDYRNFFRALLGPFWPVFEIVYVLFLVLILSVVAAAAGSIGAETFGLPLPAGTLFLIAAIAGVATFGNPGAEQLFRHASVFIYAVYTAFLVLALFSFGGRIASAFATDSPAPGWAVNGVRYASYNVVAVVAVLPFVRYLTTPRDAAIAGVLAGPLAMLPGLLFFLCIAAFYPDIGEATLPSDYLLRRMDVPWFALLFQMMILFALLETGVGIVNALNERIAEAVRGRRLPGIARLGVSVSLLAGSAFAAAAFGLVDLIARGYGAFGYIMLVIFVLPLLVIGGARFLGRDTIWVGGGSAD